MSQPKTDPAASLREQIAREIGGEAFRPAMIDGPFESETAKEKWLRRRNVAYYRADRILSLLPGGVPDLEQLLNNPIEPNDKLIALLSVYRPPWSDVYRDVSHTPDRDQQLVSVTLETARIALAAIETVQRDDAYHHRSHAWRELSSAIASAPSLPNPPKGDDIQSSDGGANGANARGGHRSTSVEAMPHGLMDGTVASIAGVAPGPSDPPPKDGDVRAEYRAAVDRVNRLTDSEMDAIEQAADGGVLGIEHWKYLAEEWERQYNTADARAREWEARHDILEERLRTSPPKDGDVRERSFIDASNVFLLMEHGCDEAFATRIVKQWNEKCAAAALTAAPDAATRLGEPVAWQFERYIGDGNWAKGVSDARPVDRAGWLRNIIPLYTSAPEKAVAGEREE